MNTITSVKICTSLVNANRQALTQSPKLKVPAALNIASAGVSLERYPETTFLLQGISSSEMEMPGQAQRSCAGGWTNLMSDKQGKKKNKEVGVNKMLLNERNVM